MDNQNDRYRLAVDAAEFGIWDYDVVNRRLECSAIFRTMLGYPPYKTIENIEDFEFYISSQDLPKFRKSLEDHINEYSPFSVDLRMLKKGGGTKWLSLKGGFQIGEQGAVSRVCAVIVDIDRYKQAEYQISQISALLSS